MQKKEKDLIIKRDELLKKLVENGNWIIGSIIETTRVQSGKKKPFYYLSRSLGGKTQTTYISKEKLNEFKKARELGENVQAILNDVIKINIQILKLQKEVNNE